jgi:tripartite-type tricarboxylate transporter receptor subunit TctC
MFKKVSVLVLVLISTLAIAQSDYPNRPITWVVPFVAGGPTDALARSIADVTGKQIGQSIIIDNVPGAGGTIGATKVARATPDGYTFLVGHMGYMGAAPALYKKLSYDPVADFEATFRFPDTPLVLMVRNNHPAKNVKELYDYAKKNPDQVFLGNAGLGSSSHLIAALVANSAGVDVKHVPYKGAGPALIDVVGGQIDGMYDQTNTAFPQITENRVRALAVTSKNRLPQLKDVPTLNETILPGFEASTWYGIYAPKGTPKPIVEKMQNAFLKAMKDKAYTDKLQSQAIQLLPEQQYLGTSLAKHTEAEVARWKAVAAKSNIAMD